MTRAVKIQMNGRKLSRKNARIGFVMVLIPLVFNLSFLYVLSVLLQNADREVLKQVRAKAIITQANALSKLFYDAGVAMGGYSVTKNALFGDRYTKIVKQIPLDEAELATLIGDNQKQENILARIRSITSDGLKILDQSKIAIDDNRVDVAQFRARHMYKEIRQLADRLQDELRGLTADERRLENMPPMQRDLNRSTVKIALISGVVLNIACAFGSLYYYTRSQERVVA